jgi:hypothetical protein
MRVLVDESAPNALKKYLNELGHTSLTVQDAGWSGTQTESYWHEPNLNSMFDLRLTQTCVISSLRRRTNGHQTG